VSVDLALTPYDRLFLAGHLALRRQGLGGQTVLALFELRGRPTPEALRRCFSRVVARHPLLWSHIRYRFWTARAYWRRGAPVPDAACDAAVYAYDLRDAIDPAANLESLRLRWLNDPPDPTRPPHLRLHLAMLTPERHLLAIHYGHYLMDLNGAWRLLAELGAEAGAEMGRRVEPAIAAAPQNGNGRSYARLVSRSRAAPSEWSDGSLAAWREGMRLRRKWLKRDAALLPREPAAVGAAIDGVRRVWSVEAGERIEALARRRCQPGPRLYTRHGLIAVLRAIDEMRDALRLNGTRYVVALPLARPGVGQRPFTPHNDLTVAMISAELPLPSDDAALDAELARQLDEYSDRRQDQAVWTLMQYAGWLRSGHYQRLVRRGEGLPQCTIGYTLYSAERDAFNWPGVTVESLSAHGVPTMPPGLMLNASRLGRRWSICATFFTHVCARPVVERLLDRIEVHLGAD